MASARQTRGRRGQARAGDGDGEQAASRPRAGCEHSQAGQPTQGRPAGESATSAGPRVLHKDGAGGCERRERHQATAQMERRARRRRARRSAGPGASQARRGQARPRRGRPWPRRPSSVARRSSLVARRPSPVVDAATDSPRVATARRAVLCYVWYARAVAAAAGASRAG